MLQLLCLAKFREILMSGPREISVFSHSRAIFELFFGKTKNLLVGASSMLWTGQWKSESVSQ